MFGKPQNTGLDPRRMRGGLSAPGRQMIKPPQPQRGGGLMGVVNRMPTEDWFRLAGALGQSGQSFLEGVGNAASTMGEMRQERQEQEWQQQLRDMQVGQYERQEQRYEQEDQDRAQEQERIAGLRQSVAAHFEQNGNSQMAEIAMNAPEETLGQLLSELTPEGRREVALFNAQMENYQARSAYRRAQAAAAMGQGAGTFGDYNNQGVERIDQSTGQRYFVHTSDDRRDPVMIRDNTQRLLSPEEAARVQPNLRAPYQFFGSEVSRRQFIDRVENHNQVAAAEEFIEGLGAGVTDPNALVSAMGGLSRFAGNLTAQVGAAASTLADGENSRELGRQAAALSRDLSRQIPSGIQSQGSLASQVESAIIELAFAKARAMNGSGRLSNEDFRQARSSLVGATWDDTMDNIRRMRSDIRRSMMSTVRADLNSRGESVSEEDLSAFIDRNIGPIATPSESQAQPQGVTPPPNATIRRWDEL